MSADQEGEPRRTDHSSYTPNFLELSRIDDTESCPNRFIQSALTEVENGCPSNELVELACYKLSSADDFPSILRHASILAMLLRTDEVGRAPVSEIVDGWARHAVDPKRWELAGILTPAELPYDDREIVENGAFNALCDALFIEIVNSSYENASIDHETVDSSLLIEQIKSIIALGRPYEQNMLETLKLCFLSTVIAPGMDGADCAEFTPFIMHELGSDVALYLEDALIDSFAVALPDTFNPIESGYIGGAVLHHFHEIQALPHYACENVLKRLAEKLTKTEEAAPRLRILSALAAYASHDTSQIDIFLENLDRSQRAPNALDRSLIVEILCAMDLRRPDFLLALISSPIFNSTIQNCANASLHNEERYFELLEACGLAITESNPRATRAFIKDFVAVQLATGVNRTKSGSLPRVFTALAVQDPVDFCEVLDELISGSQANLEAGSICAEIISCTVDYGLDWLPSRSLSALRVTLKNVFQPEGHEVNESIRAALSALDELSNYGIEQPPNGGFIDD